MFFLYTLAMKLYHAAVYLLSFFHPKAKLWIAGRRDQAARIEEKVSKWKDGNRIWIHAASYGEYEMSIPIIDALLKDGNNKIIVSFFSPSGYENVSLESDNILKLYLPSDTYTKQLRLIELIKPDKVVFIKYEFWFNLLRVLKSKNIPYYYTSLHLNADSYLLKPSFNKFTQLLKRAQNIYCHNSGSQDILRQHGFENTAVLGDTRIPKVLENKANPKSDLTYSQLNKPTIIFGSLLADEIKLLTKALKHFTEATFIIAPHEVNKQEILKLTRAIKEPVHRYSQGHTAKERIVIVDTLGDLKYLYRYADVAYVGGGFDKGPHNLLEPLVYMVPPISGPNIKKFPMAQLLKRSNLAEIINSEVDLVPAMERLLSKNKSAYQKDVASFFESQDFSLDALISDLTN